MRKLLARLASRRRDDSGGSMLVMAVLFIPFFMVTTALAIDLNKSVYVKSSFQLMAQDSATFGSRYIQAHGGIQNAAPGYAAARYLQLFDGEAGGMARGDGNTACQTVTVDGVTHRAPYMKMSLEQERSGVGPQLNYTWDPTNGLRRYGFTDTADTTGYKILRMTVWDTAPHLMLGFVGMNCQQTVSEVSAITFGSNEDVANFYG